MIPELGYFAIILAFCFALLQMASFFRAFEKFGVVVLSAQVFFLFLGLLDLIACFLLNDLTVIYVRERSHELLPLMYRIGAAWGGHEGSVLLWNVILSSWSLAFALFSKNAAESPQFYQRMIAILGLMSSGFIAFLIFTSNPFARDFPTVPIVGNDLTPILQDPGLIFHPPMLYLGYVGFAIPFAFALTALLQGKFDTKSANMCRPWVILPWSALSCGIVLGSWWAYRELGWGGWWAWDPVENASLLPWLSATALLHSLIVSEKRNSFKGWTLLLAIVTFALSLLGTFLVRSGVLVSVHAFASDPTRGLFLLAYLTFLIGGAFLLYAIKIKNFYQVPQFNVCSRETFLLLNSIFLITAVVTILLGTLYPIVLDALHLEKISVGEPYFNTVFTPIILPILILMGFAPHVHWQSQSLKKLISLLRVDMIVSAILGLLFIKLPGFPFHFFAWLGATLSIWIIIATLHFFFKQQNRYSLSYASMIVAHVGIAIIALGISINKSYSTEKQVKLSPNETTMLAGYAITLHDLREIPGPNYQSISARFDVKKLFQTPFTVEAAQRIYLSHQQTLSSPGVNFTIWRDIYIALGSPLPDQSWSVRIYYKPFVRWIWAGGFLLLLSGFLSFLNHILRKTLRCG